MGVTKRERVVAAAFGGHPDRVPVSFWRHSADSDHDADQLAEAMVAFQRAYDLDIVKLMPSGMYGTEDFGAIAGDPDPTTGAKRLIEGPIGSAGDWVRLQVAPPDQGARGRELRCLRLVRKALGPDVPVLQTVFSPLTTAAKLAGRDRLIAMLRSDPGAVCAGLETITRSEVAFVLACMEAGADGVFFATQFAGADALAGVSGGPGPEAYRTFGVPYDLRVLEPLADRKHISMLHMHGETVLFGLFAEYPLPLFNWHDRRTFPDLEEGIRLRPLGAAAGGLDERGVLLEGTPDQVAEDVHAVVRRTNGRRHVLAPGCVLPLQVPPENLDAVRGAVEAV